MHKHRAQIAALDLKLLAILNQRINLVKDLKAYKDAHGLSFHDPAQEARVMANLCQANPGPLSEEGLRELFGLIITWAKRDAAAPKAP